MAEKDIKKTPAATQTVQPSADKYTIQELENASTKVFGVTTDGDTCGFDIEVIDLDSAEHIYLNYYFQFSTIVAASGE